MLTGWIQLLRLNLNARYDDFKREFYKQCTSEFTSLWVKQINELREWINQKL